jgi:hypothetical protein
MPQYLAGVNQREERKAFNMISTIGQGKVDLMHHHNQHGVASNAMSSLSSNQNRITGNIEMKQGNLTSMSKGGPSGNGSQSNRKNFKNMFYSPKNGREAFTEPHSKMISQVQTKEHSPVHRYPPETQSN